LIDDGTWDNEHRLGAIADLALAIEQAKIDDDVMVLAGDNLFDFSLKDFTYFFTNVQADSITTYYEECREALNRTGVAELGPKSQVLSFEEKPIKPRSNNAVPPFYIYTKATIKIVQQFLRTGQNADAPGQFIAWLVKRKSIYAYKIKGKRYDIGSLPSYNDVKSAFEKNKL
jgi:glucose-1-phosphate thymidylyltransferase